MHDEQGPGCAEALGGARQLELTVADLNSDGGAVARLDGQVVFLDRGLPGERLLATVTESRKKYLKAWVDKTLEVSPHQVEAFCQYFEQCGGCAWQHLDYDEQVRWKKKRVEGLLQRMGRTDAIVGAVWRSPLLAGFRNKVTYAFGSSEQGRVVLGLRKRASHTVLPVSSCPLQQSDASNLLECLQNWANEKTVPVWNGQIGTLRHAILRTFEHESAWAWAVELICAAPLPDQSDLEALWRALQGAGAVSLYVSERNSHDFITIGERVAKRFGAVRCEAFVNGGPLLFSPPSFRQTNTLAADKLYERTLALAGIAGGAATSAHGKSAWDIYCGVGIFAFGMAPFFRQITGFEASKVSIEDARRNAEQAGFSNCRFIEGNAGVSLDKFVRRGSRDALPPNSPSLVIADPPRSGLEPGVVSALLRVRAEKLVYVSCDPATLARDVALLQPGYDVERVEIVDMFPHTPHVETLVSLRCKS